MGEGGGRGVESEPQPSPRHRLLTAVGLPLLSILVCLALIEIVLQFLPVASGLASMPVNAANPVFHFTPHRDYVFSDGWDMHRVRRGRLNNAGFVNEQDYRRDDTPPLLAVVGDSYIEALMVPGEETMQGRLARSLAGRLRVYSFAAAGGPLSQYLIWAGHAVKEYGARGVVINVIGNDFDESICAVKRSPGFWCFEPDDRGQMQLRLIDHQPGLGTGLIRMSALARYLLINLKVMQTIQAIRGFAGGPVGSAHAQPRHAGNTETGTDERRVRLSLDVIDAFFRELPRQVDLPVSRVVFVVDGFRYAPAAESGRGSYFDLMRRTFIEKARALGYEAIDLDPMFMAPERAGQRYEYPDDGHWSGTGHAVAAEAVTASRFLAGLLQ